MTRHDANGASPCHIAEHCGNKIRATVRLTLHLPRDQYGSTLVTSWARALAPPPVISVIRPYVIAI